MPFQFSIQSQNDKTDFLKETGSTTIFVGANGSGKTRLAVDLETISEPNAHRISAHRSLTLDPSVPKIGEKVARLGIKTGHPNEQAYLGNRIGSRWNSEPATAILQDFGFVLQALFGEQSNINLQSHRHLRDGNNGKFLPTKFDQLTEV